MRCRRPLRPLARWAGGGGVGSVPGHLAGWTGGPGSVPGRSSWLGPVGGGRQLLQAPAHASSPTTSSSTQSMMMLIRGVYLSPHFILVEIICANCRPIRNQVHLNPVKFVPQGNQSITQSINQGQNESCLSKCFPLLKLND